MQKALDSSSACIAFDNRGKLANKPVATPKANYTGNEGFQIIHLLIVAVVSIVLGILLAKSY
ncbi:MAG: hypothetical protein P4M11_10990 [Candidatus Pacebacteria bacterium]|nr:hypothetical protein [Candidatus Paceibacterota bacterium]